MGSGCRQPSSVRRSALNYLLQVLQSLAVLALAPLYAGALAKASAVIQSKWGPSIVQSHRDLFNWTRKGRTVSEAAGPVFRAAPYVAMGCYLVVSTIDPVITSQPVPLAFLGDLLGGALVLAVASFVMSLGAMDPGSPLGGLGPAGPPG